METNIWRKSYSSFPRLPCPSCPTGKLVLQKDTLRVVETGKSKAEHGQYGWEPEWMTQRFCCLLICNFGFCQEVVAVAGNVFVSYDENFDEQTGEPYSSTSDFYVPKSMFPPPPIFTAPKGLTENCRGHLEKAFGLFWNDLAACANRLRVFVEFFLDDMGIARKGPKKSKTGLYDGKPGKYDLFDRIALMETAHPGHHISFEALRTVGNAGSHEADADFETVLDCFEILEHALIELVDKKTEKIKAKAQKILDAKGKPRP